MVLVAAACALLTLLLHAGLSLEPQKASVWFISWQHTGHIKALCPIALELQSRGWEVRIVVHDEVVSQVPKGLPIVSAGHLPWSWDDELQFRRTLWDPMPSSPQSGDIQKENSRKADLSEQYFTGSQRSLAVGLNSSLRELPRDRWPKLLVIDISSVGAMDVAEHLDLPYAIVSAWPVGPTLQSMGDPSALAHPWMPLELPAFPQSADQQGFADRVRRAVLTTVLPWFMEFAGFNAPRRALRHEFGLGGRLELLEAPRWRHGRERPLVVVLSHWGLDRPRPLPPNVVLVGPVENYQARASSRAALPESVQAWLLQEEGRVVYLSFGTNVQPKRLMVREIMAGMARLVSASVRFLWDADQAETEAQATSEAEAESGNQLQTVPDNLLFVPRVDQLALLASGKVSAFVTHCGLNSILEALHFGVPLIGLPFLGDQLITSYLIEEAGAGVRLSVPHLSASAFERAVLRVLSEDGFRQRAGRAGALGRLAGGISAAANAIEAVAEHGAAHLQIIGDQHADAARLWDVRAGVAAAPVLVAALGWWSWTVMTAPSEAASAGTGSPSVAAASQEGASARRKKRA
mmetsp:Transcript_107755/g.300326  ORF Transcript_107755/g.300326 Transcript_107755/m.300326 type:complete len:577 (-) Transcript_107755:128-1858(-)